MPKLTDDQLANCRKIHLEGNDADRARIDALTEREADALGMTLEYLRRIETDKLMDAAARRAGHEPHEYRYSLAAETAKQFDEWCEAHAAAVRGNLQL